MDTGNEGLFDQIDSSCVNEPSASNDTETPTNEIVKNPAAVALGRLGGLKGGKARAQKLTSEQRTNIAKKAAEVRWQKHKLA